MTVWSAFTASYTAQTSRPERTRRGSMVAAFVASTIGHIVGGWVSAWRTFKSTGFSLLGLALMASSAYTLGLGWGLLATGMACCAAEWRVNG